MLPFKPITLQDQPEIEFYMKRESSYFCDYCFADVFMWKDQFQTQFVIQDHLLFMKVKTSDQTPMYIAPIGTGDFISSITEAAEDAKESGIPFMMACLSEKQKKAMETSFSDQFVFQELRDLEDYIYRSHDLITLSGNKFHSKKNHVNHFMKQYQNRWKYEAIRASNMKETMSYYEKWRVQNHEKEQILLMGEDRAIRNAFENFETLHLCGGLLRLDGHIIAFTIGTQATEDMFVIQVEKADPCIPGAYQMINQQFAIANCQHVSWINREEDLGIEGLRKAKLSYHPAFLGIKYMAKFK